MPRADPEQLGVDVRPGARAVVDIAVGERERHRREHRGPQHVAAAVAHVTDQPEQERGADPEGGEPVGIARPHGAGGEADRRALHFLEGEVGPDRETCGAADVAHREARRRAHRGRERRFATTRRTTAVAGRADVHELGVQRVQVVGAHTHAFGDAGPVSLQHDVGAAHQRLEHDAIGVVVEIEDDRLLALQHLDAGEVGERHQVADGVALRWLDLDHACALLGQERGAERCGEERSELQHRDPGQRRLGVPRRFRGTIRDRRRDQRGDGVVVRTQVGGGARANSDQNSDCASSAGTRCPWRSATTRRSAMSCGCVSALGPAR